MNMPPDLFYTDPGFVHPENVHILLEQNCSFNYFIHVDTLAMGGLPHFKKLICAVFWEDTYSNRGSHSEEQ
jgi:hypothetical protein